MLTLQCSGPYKDIPFLRKHEEVQYEVHLTELLNLFLYPALTPYVGEVSSLGINMVLLRRPFDNLWFIENHKYWSRDQEFEMRERSRLNRSTVFAR